MTMTDPIADMLTRIRNGLMVRKATISAPSSKLKLSLLKVFKEQGYITDYVERELRPNIRVIDVTLRYYEGKPAIVEISKVTTPGRKVYVGADDLPRVRGGLGVAVVSTSRGLMTDAQARQSHLGGEVLCYVY